jgi:DNA-binding beta-propeller fold protein YncE
MLHGVPPGLTLSETGLGDDGARTAAGSPIRNSEIRCAAKIVVRDDAHAKALKICAGQEAKNEKNREATMNTIGLWTAIAVVALMPFNAYAEIAVSANDGKQLRAGDTVSGPTPDGLTVIDIDKGRVRVLGAVEVPAAMIGPPRSVALTADSKLAIATACQSLAGDKLMPADIVSVIDLAQPSHPKVVQTLHAGAGASGVAISPDGKLVLVANAEGNSISIFSMSGRSLSNAGTVSLGEGTRPTDVLFTPDGKTAIAVAQRASKLVFLSVNGTQVSPTGKSASPGRTPYGAVATHDGKYVIATNLGGALPPPGAAQESGRGMSRAGTISMTEIVSGATTASVVVGQTPEHVTLSDDGKYAAVVVANGTASVRSDPKFDSVLGLLEIYAVGEGTLTPVTRSDTGHWCQGAAFSKDNRTILLQCAAEREIEVFRFDGKVLQQDRSATIPLTSRPGAIATALSR